CRSGQSPHRRDLVAYHGDIRREPGRTSAVDYRAIRKHNVVHSSLRIYFFWRTRGVSLAVIARFLLALSYRGTHASRSPHVGKIFPTGTSSQITRSATRRWRVKCAL